MNDLDDIVETSVANFATLTGLSLTVASDKHIILSDHGNRHQFSYSVAKSVTAPKASSVERSPEEAHLLVSHYISAAAKRYLREHEINYLDAIGNAYLSIAGEVLVYIETGKSARVSPIPKGRAFTQAGLRVVYQFLINDAINRPYREIGELAGVSIDTVSKTVKDLLSSAYLIETRPKLYGLNKQAELVENWVTAYNRILRPRLKSAYFSFGRDTGPHDLARNCAPNTLGGELAADMLGTDLIGDRATLYTDQSFHGLARMLDLVPAGEEGPVEIVRQFWTGIPSEELTVNLLLVYADLRYRPTSRNLAAAAQLYETHVRPSL